MRVMRLPNNYKINCEGQYKAWSQLTMRQLNNGFKCNINNNKQCNWQGTICDTMIHYNKNRNVEAFSKIKQ